MAGTTGKRAHDTALRTPQASAHRRRREQETEEGTARSPVLVPDSTSGQTVACVATPCQLQGVCMNGGTCEAADGEAPAGRSAFTCSCADDFYGVRCESVRECASSPCQNGGVCDDSTTDAMVESGAYYCNCGAWSGCSGPRRSSADVTGEWSRRQAGARPHQLRRIGTNGFRSCRCNVTAYAVPSIFDC